MTQSLDDKLRNFLNSRWLRPESVLFGTLKSRAFDEIQFGVPSVDISCGDGTLMFQHFGGIFGLDYDLYVETDAAAFSHEKFVDIYDFDGAISPDIIAPPSYQFDVGTDWKPELLNKAARLGAYKNLIQHDNNEIPLPFDAAQFQTVFSTAFYWTNDVSALVKEAHRILTPGGNLVLTAQTPNMLKTLDALVPHLSPKAISILDRNRRATMQNAMDANTWRSILENAGFSIKQTRSVFPDQVLMDLWNVGFRPISHLLIQMAQSLDGETRRKIKQEWMGILFELLRPLAARPITCSAADAPYLLIEGVK